MAVTVKQEVAALYSAIFNRAPDQAGLEFWAAAIEGGDSLTKAAEGFTQHPVFAEVYGDLSNQAKVEALYTNVLGSAGDAAGIQFWVAKLESGVSFGQVVAEFVSGALTIDLDALLASGELSQADYDAAVVRQNSITNKADAGVYFADTFGAASNLSATTDTTTKEGLESDPVYLASQAAIAGVTNDPATLAAAKAAIDAAKVPSDLNGPVENTAPEAIEAAAEVAEGATFAGQLEATDPDVADQGDALTFALAEGQEAVAGFTLNADGSYSFDAAQEAFQALQAGDTQDVVINYTVTDSKGATSTSTLTLTVTGTDDAPVVAIAEGTEKALLTGTVFGAQDSISDVDGFGGGATVTLAYAEAVIAAGQYGAPIFVGTDEFRVARDGNTFTLIAKGGDAADTAIGTVTPVGLKEVLAANGQGTGDYIQTGYTLELNENVSPEILTALLKQLNVQAAADGSNTQLTVTIASQGGAESVEFVRNIEGADGGGVTLTKAATDPLEAELIPGALNTQSANVPFTAFGELDLDVGSDALINGMTIELSSTNQADKFALAADSVFEIINGQLILKAEVEAEARVVAEVSGIGTNNVVVTFASEAGLTESQVENQLIERLLLDLEDAIGQRTVNLNVTSGDGLSEASLSREISVLGEFTAVTLAQIAAADATAEPSTAVTIGGNTILNVADFNGALDIQAQVDAGNLIIEGANPIRVTVGNNANLSEVEGLELLGDLRIQSVANGSTLTLNATQVDFLSTASKAAGTIAVVALENNLDANLSVLEAQAVTAQISANAGNVTFTGDFGTAVVTVGAGSILTATAAVLSEVTVNGTVVVTGLDGAAAYDLAGLNAATAVLAAGDTTLNEETDLGTVAITVPQNSELVLTAAQANGTAIAGGDVNGTGNKGGSVTVLGLVDGVDLSHITVSKVLAGAVNATQSDLIVTFRAEDEEAVDGVAGTDGVISGVDLGKFSVQVEAGATLRIDEQANGAIITGAGSVEVHVDNAGALDLSEITVEGDKLVKVTADADFASAFDSLGLGEAIDFGDFAVNVAANATLTLTAAQASGLTITGESVEVVEGLELLAKDVGGSVVIELDGAAAYNLSNIKAGAESVEDANDAGTLIATVAASAVLDAETDLGDFSLALNELLGQSIALTLSAAQATARVITGDANDSVIVEGLAADTDLSGIVANIAVTANVAKSIDISANDKLDNVDTFAVANDAVLTLSARQADEQAVTVAPAVAAGADTKAQAAGAVVVTGPVEAIKDGDNALDFTSLPNAFTFAGGELVIGEGVSLTLTAAQASGKVITGAGNVVVTGLQAGTDLSGITVEGTKTAIVTGNLTLGSTADLGDFAVEVTPGHTLTLTAAQAAALVTLEGAGAVVVNGTAVVDTLDFSGKADWSIDTLTINGGGGADVLTAPTGVNNVILIGGSNADTFNVPSGTVTIGDFTPGVDELVIAAGATANIKLTANTDLSATQAAALLSNEGTLRVDLNGFKLTATAGQLAKIEVEDTLAHLLAMAKDTAATGKVALTASAVIASDIGVDGEAVTFNNVKADQPATTIDFVDNEATLTFAQLGQITDALGANLSLTDADAITVTGVANAASLKSVDAELNDTSDTIEVSDGATISLAPAELNALRAFVTADADADGLGADATVYVTLVNGDEVTRATDLVDTFNVNGLVGGQSAIIAGLGVDDVISTGLAFGGEGASGANGILTWLFDDQNDTLTYEVSDDHATVETVTVTLTGVASVTQADGSFTVTGLDYLN